MSALKNECLAWQSCVKLLGQLCWESKVNTKVSLMQYFAGIFGLICEALTDNGQTCEQVAEACCGKGNFKALEGKVAILTGATSGLGLENARVLMKYGCHVIWAVRNPAKAQYALQEIEKKDGKYSGKATIIKVDLSDLTTVKPFVRDFLELNLPLHMLILNAGIMAPVKWEASAQGYENMFATNNLSHFLMTKLLLPKLEVTAETSDVRVVILSSITASMCSGIDVSKVPVSKEWYHEFADYCVTKAIDSFQARSLQKRYAGSQIYVTAVHPGIINTGLLSHNETFANLFFNSYTLAPFRKGLPSGAATTIYCALSADIPEQVKKGTFFYYNRGPQKSMGIAKPGVADHLVDELEKLQFEMVKAYM